MQPFSTSPAQVLSVPARGEAIRLQAFLEPLRALLPQILTSGFLVDGPQVQALEQALHTRWHAPAVVCCDSGTDALVLALLAAGVGPGDEVLVPALSFISTAFAVNSVGALPVFVDVDPVTATMSPTAAAAALTPRTKAIIPVALFGQAADIDALLQVAQRAAPQPLAVIHDASQAHGARYRERTVGALGCTFETFSLAPVKNLGGMRFGGCVTMSDPSHRHRLVQLRNLGRLPGVGYLHTSYGVRANMDELNAALIRLQLDALPAWNQERQELAAWYDTQFASCAPEVMTPETAADRTHVYWLYCLTCATPQRRAALHRYLRLCGVESQHYPYTLPDQPVYRKGLPHRVAGPLAIARDLVQRHLWLPLYPELTQEQRLHVVACVQRALQRPLRRNHL